MINKSEPQYINDVLCSACGGICCNKMPGSYFPSDFGKDVIEIEHNLFKFLSDGKGAIDWWEGNSPEYYIRPAVKGCKELFHPSWGGECVFLDDKCTLSYEKRPHGCRMLEPKRPNCIAHDDSKRGGVKAWEKYQDLILRVSTKLQNEVKHHD